MLSVQTNFRVRTNINFIFSKIKYWRTFYFAFNSNKVNGLAVYEKTDSEVIFLWRNVTHSLNLDLFIHGQCRSGTQRIEPVFEKKIS